MDREDKREITMKEGLSLGIKFRCPFEEFSAKISTQEDIRELLFAVIDEIKQARKEEEVDYINHFEELKKKAKNKKVHLYL